MVLNAWYDKLLYIVIYSNYHRWSFQIRFPVGGERVTCRGSKLTNSLGKQQLELSTRTWPGRAPWNRGKFVCQPASSKRFLRSFFSIFELGGITKHLMTGPAGNSEFCFPSTSMFPSASPQGTFWSVLYVEWHDLPWLNKCRHTHG